MPQVSIEGHTFMGQERWQSLENDGPKTGMVPGLVVFIDSSTPSCVHRDGYPVYEELRLDLSLSP